MAKKSTSKNTHTHVPTKASVTIIALVVIVMGIFFTVSYNQHQNNHNTQFEAATLKTGAKDAISKVPTGAPTAVPRKCTSWKCTHF